MNANTQNISQQVADMEGMMDDISATLDAVIAQNKEIRLRLEHGRKVQQLFDKFLFAFEKSVIKGNSLYTPEQLDAYIESAVYLKSVEGRPNIIPLVTLLKQS